MYCSIVFITDFEEVFFIISKREYCKDLVRSEELKTISNWRCYHNLEQFFTLYASVLVPLTLLPFVEKKKNFDCKSGIKETVYRMRFAEKFPRNSEVLVNFWLVWITNFLKKQYCLHLPLQSQVSLNSL